MPAPVLAANDPTYMSGFEYNTLNESTQAKLTNLVRNNPELAKNPYLLNGFASQNNLNSNQISGSLKYLTAYGGIKNYGISQMQGQPSHGQGFWSSIWGSVRHAWDSLGGSFEALGHSFSTNIHDHGVLGGVAGALADNTAPIATGAYHGTKDLVNLASSITNRVALTGAEVATGGMYGPNGWNTNFGGLNDAFNTVRNAVTTTGNMVNPFSRNNAFFLMSHNMAFYESMAQRYGWGYTFGYMVPSIMAGVATDGLMSGPAAELESDAAILERGIAAKVAGRKMSPFEERQFEQATRRQVERDRINLERSRSQDLRDVIEGKRTSRSALKSVARRAAASKTAEFITKPVGGVFSVARKVGAPMSDVKLNAMYTVSQQLAQQDPGLSKLWNNPHVQNGVAVDASGRPMGTNGQMIASYFGLDGGNMFFSPVSGLTDFYTKWMGADPLGAYGKVIGRARTFDGFSGMLRHWYGGLGIRGADDIYRTADEYRRVRKAFEYMASHDASQIADTFRNTYVDDAARNIKSSSIIKQLGDAKTVDEVMKIHADLAESVAITRNMVPTLSAYEIMKASLKGALGERLHTVGQALSTDGEYLKSISKAVFDETGVPVKPDSNILYTANDANIRGLNSFARWIGTRLTRSRMYVDELTGSIENEVIRPGSVNAIPAIMDMLRASLLPENVVRGVGDLLLHTDNPQDYINAYRNAVYHAVMRRATAGLDHVEMNTFISTASDHIWNEILKMTGLDGGGARGIYVAGENGQQLSLVLDAAAGREGFAGIGSTHLGAMHFPRNAELKGLAEKVKGIVVGLSKNSAASASYARHLDLASLLSTATYHEANLDGLIPQLDRLGPSSELHLAPHAEGEINKAVDGYREAIDTIKGQLKAHMERTDVPLTRKFVDAYQDMKNGLLSAQRDMELLSSVNRTIKAYGEHNNLSHETLEAVWEKFPGANIHNIGDFMKPLYGKESAYQDALRQMEVRMSEPSMSLTELGKTNKAFSDAMKGKNEADMAQMKEFRKGIQKIKSRQDRRFSKFDTKAELLVKEGSVSADEYNRRLLLMKARSSPYVMGFQRVVDGINRFLNRTFVPMALTSGGWSLRVATSEIVLNTLRNGFWPTFDAKVTRAIAKHEAYGRQLVQGLATQESNLIRDVVAGALMGVEKSVVSGMSQAQRDRMLENFVGTIMRYDGHLPGGIHDTQNTVFSDETLKSAAEGQVYGIGPDGNPTMSMTHRGPNYVAHSKDSLAFVTALYENTSRISHDELLAPVAQRMDEMLRNAGIDNLGGQGTVSDENLIRAGAKDFRSPQGVAVMRAELEKTALQAIQKMDPVERARYARDTGRVVEGAFTRDTAHEEWAAVIAEHVIKSLSGSRGETTYFYPSLVMQAATGDMKDMQALTNDVRKMPPGASPQFIPAAATNADPLSSLVPLDFLKKVSDYGHEKVLGPIINRLVREHTFLMEQHRMMENLRPLVEKNIIDEPTAQLLADQRALGNMIKFVHNPKDKTLFEQNMRVAAPFYFAQNQAWRRALRVMHDDPGAFEKYLKLSLGVTDYISKQSVGGTTPSIAIPGTEFLGMMGMAGTNNPLTGFAPGAFDSLGFGLAADPGSISSVFPTGSQGGLAGLLGIARPAWGPVVTIPIKVFEKMWGQSEPTMASKFFAAVLGPISANSSLQSDFFPSTIGRNLLESAVALGSAAGIIPYSTDAQNSTENYILNNAVSNLFQKQLTNVMNTTDFSGINTATGRHWDHDQIVVYARAQAELAVAKYFNNHENLQLFLDHARAAAVTMMLVKGVLAFASPVALSVQQTFSQVPELQKLMNEKNPNGSPKYTFVQAATLLTQEHPTAVFDLVAHSQSNYASFPETQSAVTFLEANRSFVLANPNLAAFLINRNSAYSPLAYQLELSLGLRSREAPQQYLNSLLVAAGNDFYYNYLAVQPQFGGDGTKAGTNISYEQYKNLTSEAKAYGRTTNPTWYSEFAGGSKANLEIKAINEMTRVLNGPSVPTSVMSREDKSKFIDLMKQYNQVINEIKTLKAAGDNSIAAEIENSWYQGITAQSTDPYWRNQSYFMTSVLRGLPTK